MKAYRNKGSEFCETPIDVLEPSEVVFFVSPFDPSCKVSVMKKSMLEAYWEQVPDTGNKKDALAEKVTPPRSAP